jgi:hypothetical protein
MQAGEERLLLPPGQATQHEVNQFWINSVRQRKQNLLFFVILLSVARFFECNFGLEMGKTDEILASFCHKN